MLHLFALLMSVSATSNYGSTLLLLFPCFCISIECAIISIHSVTCEFIDFESIHYTDNIKSYPVQAAALYLMAQHNRPATILYNLRIVNFGGLNFRGMGIFVGLYFCGIV